VRLGQMCTSSSNARFAAGRPEHLSKAAAFYGDEEVARYSDCSQTITIQRELARRALELLGCDPEQGGTGCGLLLDIGCGSGLSGRVLSEAGIPWLGTDISASMLSRFAQHERSDGSASTSCGVVLSDAGQGLAFRERAFTHAISISAIQWLCYLSQDAAINRKALGSLFTQLSRVLVHGGCAVLQLYIEDMSKARMMMVAAAAAGMCPTLFADLPHRKGGVKYFMCVQQGQVVPRWQAHAAKEPPGALNHPDCPLAWPLAGCCTCFRSTRFGPGAAPPRQTASDARTETAHTKLAAKALRCLRVALRGSGQASGGGLAAEAR